MNAWGRCDLSHLLGSRSVLKNLSFRRSSDDSTQANEIRAKSFYVRPARRCVLSACAHHEGASELVALVEIPEVAQFMADTDPQCQGEYSGFKTERRSTAKVDAGSLGFRTCKTLNQRRPP